LSHFLQREFEYFGKCIKRIKGIIRVWLITYSSMVLIDLDCRTKEKEKKRK